MANEFLHGIEVVEIESGPRPIRTARSSVIGLIGSAPNADAAKFPYHSPILIAGSQSEAAMLGKTGTLPAAIADIFNQTGAMVIVIRMPEADPDEGVIAAEISQIIGGIDAETGHYQGCQAFLSAESEVGLSPRILIAPEYSHHPSVANALNQVAQRLRAIAIIDGPNENDQAAIDYRKIFSSARLYLVDPWVRIWDNEADVEVVRPASSCVAGLIAKVDSEQGFWFSPSNQPLQGIVGTTRSVDFAWGDTQSRANLLNENEVATIIQKDGFRLWGNRSCSTDPKWAFLSVRRTADRINEALLQTHLWALDRNISKTYIADVLEGVNAYLRKLTTQGAIINGRAWADPELNTPESIVQGKLYIDFDFTPPYPAEHISFRSHLTNDYLVEVLPDAS